MNRELELKLQAYMDGELPEREARQIQARLAEDAEATRLLSEMTWTRSILSEHEPVIAMPESHDFYWSKISRAIEHEQARREQSRTLWDVLLEMFPWRRALAPLSGLAVAMFLVVGFLKFYDLGAFEGYPRHLAQVVNPSDEMGAFSFRSQSENVFVIWLYERTPEVQIDMTILNDMILQ